MAFDDIALTSDIDVCVLMSKCVRVSAVDSDSMCAAGNYIYMC